MEPNQSMKQDIAKKEKELEELYSELQRERLKIDKERDVILSKKKLFPTCYKKSMKWRLLFCGNKKRGH